MNPTTLHILEPIPKRREDPRVTANIAIADSLKALDFNRPNREEPAMPRRRRFRPCVAGKREPNDRLSRAKPDRLDR